MRLCKHQPHKVINDIWEPRYHDKSILIHVDKVPKDIEHFIIQFSHESPKKLYSWFYLSGKTIRRSKRQKNGNGEVYVVSLNKRQPFEPIKDCHCENAELVFEY